MKGKDKTLINLFTNSGVSCYIIHGKNGDLLVDTGFIGSWKKLSQWLSAFSVKHVFLTHAHADHDWNALRLQQGGAQIILCMKDQNLRSDFFAQPVKAVFSNEKMRVSMQKIGSRLCKSMSYEPDFYVQEHNSQLLRTLGYDAEIVMLPGHTEGSMGILHSDVLYCGDAFTMLRGIPEIPPTAVNVKLLRESLQKILRINPEWLACGHGLPVRMFEAKPVMESFVNEIV